MALLTASEIKPFACRRVSASIQALPDAAPGKVKYINVTSINVITLIV